MIPALVAILAIILESWSSIWHSVDFFLQSQQLTVGAIITAMVPFFVIWNKISKEKEKRVRAAIVERRQLQIAFNVNEIMEKLGVESKWSLQEIGSSHEVHPSLKGLRLLSRAASIQKRRMKMLKNLFKTSISKKLLALLVGAAVATLNKKFNLDLNPLEVVAFLITVFGYIVGQSHVDAKKVLAGVKDSPLLTMGFNEAIPILQGIHDDINEIVKDVRRNDGSQAYKDAMKAYAQIKPILDAIKHPSPVAVIVEDKVAS